MHMEMNGHNIIYAQHHKTGIVVAESFRGWNRPLFSLFCEVLDSSKPPNPLHMGPFTRQIYTDLRGVKICVKRAEMVE